MKIRTAFFSILAALLLGNAYWCFRAYSEEAEASNSSEVLEKLNLKAKDYILVSAHREENIDIEENFIALMNAINAIPKMEEMPDESSTKGKSMEEQIEIIKDYICLIKIY